MNSLTRQLHNQKTVTLPYTRVHAKLTLTHMWSGSQSDWVWPSRSSRSIPQLNTVTSLFDMPCGDPRCWNSFDGFRHAAIGIEPWGLRLGVGHNTDAADAETICEAVTHPTMRSVPVKSPEEQVAGMTLLSKSGLSYEMAQ
eukprot:gene18327-18590_t